MNELRGNLDNIYKALKDLQITPLIAEYDYVCISDDDYHKHNYTCCRRRFIFYAGSLYQKNSAA